MALLSPLLLDDERVLVAGGDVATSLAALVDGGLTNVEGAVDARIDAESTYEAYPQLRRIQIHVGSLTSLLEGLDDDAISTSVIVDSLGAESNDPALGRELVRVSRRVIVVDRALSRKKDSIAELLVQSGAAQVVEHSISSAYSGRYGVFAGSRIGDFRRMDRPTTLYDFWRRAEPDGNRPGGYVMRTGRSEALAEVIADLPTSARILEIGCNVGRNLAYLHDAGYHRVEGIEINPNAIALLRDTFPQLNSTVIHEGPAGEHITRFADDEFDLIFTMAVIEHLHPEEAELVFDAMVRAGKEIVAIEPRPRVSHRQYPHDVPAAFESRGLELVLSRPMRDFPSNADDPAMEDFTLWRFHRKR
jgi:SAM-dependent methyltransferase